MKDLVSSHVHSSWRPIFEPIRGSINEVLRSIEAEDIAPKSTQIFRSFEIELSSVKCVIVGQDPYPTRGNATGLAFSIPSTQTKIPQTLRNIFAELQEDEGVAIPGNGDLSSWSEAGVLLMNRILTTRVGESNAHAKIGWQAITDHIAAELGKRGVIAILWGNHAQELEKYFTHAVSGVHPSPLSAYRGFFGSKPFSTVNSLLEKSGSKPINWSL